MVTEPIDVGLSEAIEGLNAEADAVYSNYCRFKRDELDHFLALPAVARSPLLREKYCRFCEPLLRDAFFEKLNRMTSDDRREFTDRWSKSFEHSISETWDQVRQELDQFVGLEIVRERSVDEDLDAIASVAEELFSRFRKSAED